MKTKLRMPRLLLGLLPLSKVCMPLKAESAKPANGRLASVVAACLNVMFYLVLPVSIIGTANAAPELVSVEQGQIRGVLDGNIVTFKGIRYAAPPVGALRWRLPEPAAAWAKPLEAKTYGNECAQTEWYPPFKSTTDANAEDCLYLNVFMPAATKGKLPVMVWFHGGANNSGASQEFDGSQLASQGVIIVTVNYRLGAFGFMAMPALDEESPHHVSGNYGIADQQAALRWVKQNIGAFGGDAQNVTIFGQSAGSRDVCVQMLSPMASGLFQKAIAQSGPCSSAWRTLSEVESQAGSEPPAWKRVVDKLGCGNGPNPLECLRAKPPADVLLALGGNVSAILGTWEVIVDGYLLPDEPAALVPSGQFNKVPLITGSTHDEWDILISFLLAHYPDWSLDMAGKAQMKGLGAYSKLSYSSVSGAADAVYKDDTMDQARRSSRYVNDRRACTQLQATVDWSKHTTVFGYEFSGTPLRQSIFAEGSTNQNKYTEHAYHTAELPFLWGYWYPVIGTPQKVEFTAPQKKLSEAMVGYWISFAKSGQPAGKLSWPAYAADNRLMSFNSVHTQLETRDAFRADHHCDFWENQ